VPLQQNRHTLAAGTAKTVKFPPFSSKMGVPTHDKARKEGRKYSQAWNVFSGKLTAKSGVKRSFV